MDETNSLIEQRKAKLASLRSKNIDPFRNKFTPTEKCAEARGNYTEGRPVELAGRITAHRDMGKSMFIDIKDQSGRIQVYAQKNVIGEEQFDIFRHLDLADFIGVKGTLFTTKTGEISVKLEAFTILAKSLRPPPAKWHGLEDMETRYRQRYLDLIANDDVKKVFLQRSAIVHEIRGFFHSRGYVEVETPAMQPIPGGAAAQPFKTFHNALGCEFYLRIALELYHKRLLVGGIDRLFEIGKNFRNEGLSRRHNPEFTMLEAYCAFGDYETMMETVESLIKGVAEKVIGKLEIQRPVQNDIGAAIQSCRDRFENLGKRLFDKTSDSQPENLRALSDTLQEVRSKFNQLAEEFPNIDAKEAGKRALELIKLAITALSVEEAFSTLETLDAETARSIQKENRSYFKRTQRALEIAVNYDTINLASPWKKRRYKELVSERVRKDTNGKCPDWFSLTPMERRRVAIEELHLGGDIADGYEDFEVTGAVFGKLVEPTLIDPTFVTHLPKELVPLAKLTPDDPTTVEVFECCINGQEISPGYTEQNDPIQQRETLEHQAGGEQQKLDEDFLVALEHGMPPAGGIGIGIDRLCMMLLGQESIRDVILFPQLKPKQ